MVNHILLTEVQNLTMKVWVQKDSFSACVLILLKGFAKQMAELTDGLHTGMIYVV
jgi:hypothetical protein